MSEAGLPKPGTGSWFERLVSVPVTDPDLARRGRLFNILMLLSVVIALGVGGIFFAVRFWGGFTTFPVWAAASFPGSVMLLSAVGIGLAKQRRIQTAIVLYVSVMTVAVSMASFVFDGYRSPAIVLHIWSVIVAGSLLTPGSALLVSGLAAFWWIFLFIAQLQGIYQPPFDTGDALYYISPAFIVVIMVFGVGAVTFLNLRSLQDALSGLRRTTSQLEEERRLLERRVDERTAQARRRAEEFQIIAELSRVIGAAAGIEELLDVTVHFIADRFGFYHVGIFLLDETKEWAVLRAVSSEGGQRMLSRLHRLQVGTGIVGFVVETGQPRIVSDVGGDMVWVRNPDLPETRSEMALPLEFRGAIVGVLDIQSREAAAFTEEDAQILRLLADSVVIALENMRLLQETRAALADLSRYREEETLKAWRAMLSRQNLRVAYTYDGVMTQVVGLDQAPLPLLPQETQGVQVFPVEEGHSLMVAPVRIRDHTVGLLSFEATHPWTEDEVRLTQTVVEQLGLALENARLLEETQRRALQERARSEIVGRVRTSVNIDAILRTVAQELGKALQVDRSRIQLLPPDEIGAEDK